MEVRTSSIITLVSFHARSVEHERKMCYDMMIFTRETFDDIFLTFALKFLLNIKAQ